MVGTEQVYEPVRGQPNVSDLLAVIDKELGTVFAFLLRRCGDRALAEDLTADVVVRAVHETKRSGAAVTPAWLTTVARHRLVDHWRSRSREERRLELAWSNPEGDEWSDDGMPLEPDAVHRAMRGLSPDHQAVLALRYLDDLTVPEVADALDRSIHATESLLARARRAFRTNYLEQSDG